jgi:haloacetate dehalogenase
MSASRSSATTAAPTSRMALDHPDRVSRLAVLDAIPIVEALERCDARFASSWWHWFFLSQTEKPAELVITADPEAWYRPDRAAMGEETCGLPARHPRPATVHAMCEDYRAGLGVDRAADDADRAAGRRIACPVLVLWASFDDMEDLYGDVLSVWRPWAPDLRGHGLACGHHMSEEVPEALARDLLEFLGS